MGNKELIKHKLWNSGTSILQISYATKVLQSSLYLFRLSRKELSADNLQKLADYFHLELLEAKE